MDSSDERKETDGNNATSGDELTNSNEKEQSENVLSSVTSPEPVDRVNPLFPCLESQWPNRWKAAIAIPPLRLICDSIQHSSIQVDSLINSTSEEEEKEKEEGKRGNSIVRDYMILDPDDLAVQMSKDGSYDKSLECSTTSDHKQEDVMKEKDNDTKSGMDFEHRTGKEHECKLVSLKLEKPAPSHLDYVKEIEANLENIWV